MLVPPNFISNRFFKFQDSECAGRRDRFRAVPGNIAGFDASIKTVRLPALRVTLTGLMIAFLLITLHRADQEDRLWLARQRIADKETGASEGTESFVLPYRHSSPVEEAVGFQWPAFVAASLVAPVPQMSYAAGKPILLTTRSYAVLALTVGLYWLALASWSDRLLARRPLSMRSRPARILFMVITWPAILLFAIFLLKDLLPGGWPEGANGAYGFTAWLGLISILLLGEVVRFARA